MTSPHTRNTTVTRKFSSEKRTMRIVAVLFVALVFAGFAFVAMPDDFFGGDEPKQTESTQTQESSQSGSDEVVDEKTESTDNTSEPAKELTSESNSNSQVVSGFQVPVVNDLRNPASSDQSHGHNGEYGDTHKPQAQTPDAKPDVDTDKPNPKPENKPDVKPNPEPDSPDPKPNPDPENPDPENPDPENPDPIDPELVGGWDVSVAGDGTVKASLVALDDGSFNLTFKGKGAIKDFKKNEETPWAADAEVITRVTLADGITQLGSYNVALPHLQVITAGTDLESLGADALADAPELVAVNFGQSTLKSVDSHALSSSKSDVKRTIYVKDKASLTAFDGVDKKEFATTAVAVLNGGGFAADTVFQAGVLATPVKESATFVTWTSDEGLMHPSTIWRPYAKGASYARFSGDDSYVDPVPYPGYQGMDQHLQMLEVSKLPGSYVKAENVMYWGSEGRYLNQCTKPYNGNKTIVFGFSIDRGTNINGGDGSYFKSFTLPFISILDAQGNVVADYKNGSGDLKLYGMSIDGSFDKVKGNSVWGVVIGVEPNTLPDGNYTLRFSKDLGSNNGKSKLGKDIDLMFEVKSPATYTLTMDEKTDHVVVTGIETVPDTMSDVVIPATFNGKPVTEIAPQAFKGAELVESIQVPASVENIGEGAFADMANLKSVKVLSQDAAKPVWGEKVFSSSAELNLYGFEEASTVKACADTYKNITFIPLNDGIYLNGALLNPETVVTLNSSNAVAEVRIMSNMNDVTNKFTGYITQNRVMTHPSTDVRHWNSLEALANGESQLVIRDKTGADWATLSFKVEGFAKDASYDLEKNVSAQGQGANVRYYSRNGVMTKTYDESLTYFDNFLPEPVSQYQAEFSFELGGPGSGWDVSRWDWDDWTKNHLNPFVSLVDETGATVARVGEGLTWTKITDKMPITVAIDPSVLEAGKSYSIVFGAPVTGHNVSAQLLTEVRWTFTVVPTSLDVVTVGEIAPQTLNGAVCPEPHLTLAYEDSLFWNTSTESIESFARDSYTLVSGVDYDVAYENNDRPGKATVIVTGKGAFTGELRIEFDIVESEEGLEPDSEPQPEPNSDCNEDVRLESSHNSVGNNDVESTLLEDEMIPGVEMSDDVADDKMDSDA